jgi:hypothetical protein
MSLKDPKLYYMCVVRDRTILADYSSSEYIKAKSNYQMFTNEKLASLTRGTYNLGYKEYT